MSQDPKWLRGWNDGVVFAVEELLLNHEPDSAELLMPHVHVEELTREQVRRLRGLANKRQGRRADKILDVLRSAKADRRPSEPRTP